MSRYFRLNLRELVRIFQTGAKLELQPTHESFAKTGRNFSIPAYVTRWLSDHIVLTLPEPPGSNNSDLLPLLAVGRIITLQTGGVAGSYRFKTKITAFNASQNELTIELPVIMTNCEMRRSQRFPLKASVTYQVIRLNNRELHHLSKKIGIGASQDLNCYGMNLITDLFLPVGITLAIHLTLNGQALTTYGVVRRARALNTSQNLFATGIKFSDPDPEFQTAVNQAITKSTALFTKRVLV